MFFPATNWTNVFSSFACVGLNTNGFWNGGWKNFRKLLTWLLVRCRGVAALSFAIVAENPCEPK